MNFKWDKQTLNYISTFCGVVGSIVVILAQYNYLPSRPANCIGAICGAIVAFIVQQPTKRIVSSPDETKL